MAIEIQTFLKYGVSCANPNKKELKQLSSAIENFNKGHEREEQIAEANTLAEKYIKNGAEIIISGCTEISLMLADSKVPKIDTMDLLAKATVKYFILSVGTQPPKDI